MLKNTYTMVAMFIVLFFASNVEAKSSKEQTMAAFQQQLDAHRGKVVYLDFWASWCGPCRQSFPWMNEMQKNYQQQGFVVLSVNVDHDKSFATEFLTEQAATFDIFYDPKGQVAREFKLKGMPSSFIINRAGEIVSSHVGFTEKKKIAYQAEIVALLKQ